MHEKPRVSILMPLLNAETYLKETLDTVVSQTSHDWEVVALDGQSTDATPAILAEYAARYPNIKIFSEPSPSPYFAILKAAEYARGDFFMVLCASDGYINKNWIARCLETLDANPDVSLVWGITFQKSEEGKMLGPHFVYAHFLQEPEAHSRTSIMKQILGKIDLRHPSSLLEFFKKFNRANATHLRHMLQKEPLPHKEAWFAYWLKTGTIFPDGNLCVTRKVFLEFMPPYKGGSDPGNWMSFFFDVNAQGYLSYGLPEPANFGRIHGGQVSEWAHSHNEETKQEYFKKLEAFRKNLAAHPGVFTFRGRAGEPLKEPALTADIVKGI